MTDFYESNRRAVEREIRRLDEALVRVLSGRQRRLTDSLGQPTCVYDHEFIFYWNPETACRGCGAAI